MAVNYGQVAIVPKGAWNAETQYKVNNLVSYDGSSYVAKVQPPVGTLPTDTSYWQVSAAGTKKATADSLGTVMPDGTTTSVGEDGKLSVNTAQQDALGVVKGSDDITVGEDGTLTVNTTFEQATELANIIAGEAIKSVLGKVSKAIATTMSLDENALLKNMISGIDVNDSNKVPSSAYIHTLVERIGMGTELVSGLGDLTTGLNTVNNNLSKWKLGHSSNYFLAGNDMSGSKLYLATGQNLNNFYQLYADEDYLRFGKQSGGNWTECWRAALKSDLISGAEFGGIKFYTVENSTNQIVTRKISAQNGGHLTGLLIVDYNGTAGIFAVGKIGGVKTLVGLPGFDAPSILNDVLSVQLSAWGSATLIGYGDATIS